MRPLWWTSPGLLVGLAAIVAGVLLLLDMHGIVAGRHLLRYWPVVVIAAGLVKLLTPGVTASRVWGGFLVFLGLALLPEPKPVPLRMRDLWPLILIAAGLSLTFERLWGANPRRQGHEDPASLVNGVAVFGAVKRNVTSPEFRGGEVVAIFGGYNVDLTSAGLAEGGVVIHANAILGGVEIRVPTDWSVVIEGMAFMGGFEDQTPPRPLSDKQLVVRGVALLGGVEVKN